MLILVTLQYLILQKKGCSNLTLVGDGYCNDETNVLECNFDDGDCCGPNITTTHCTECQCLEVIVPPSGNILFKYIILNLIPC